MAMRKQTIWVGFLGAFVAALMLVGACTGDIKNGLTLSGPGGGAAQGPSSGTGGDLFSTGTSADAVLTLEPKIATIEVVNGVSSPVAFTANFGDVQVFPGTWYVDRTDVASVNAEGLFSALNTKGAQVKLFAKANGQVAQALVNVIYKKVSDGGLPDDTKNKLENPVGDDASITWAYPYNNTVWPRGLLAPELMWKGGGAGDSYLVHFTSGILDIKLFTQADNSAYLLEQLDWVAVSESGNGNTVKLAVSRLKKDEATAKKLVDHEWTMAKGSMRGSVYYWVNNLGRVVRLKPGQEAPEDFLKTANVNGCSTCHAVSANGRTLIIGGDVAVSKFDLLNNQPVFSTSSVGKSNRNWAMPAISPDGKFVVENNAPLPGPPGGSDGMFDSDTGQKIPMSGLEDAKLWMPAFSPKGHKLVYVEQNNTHDLATYDFDLALGKASSPHALVAAGGDDALRQICFPSVSPTIKGGEMDEGKTWAVYHRGTTGSLDTRFGPGDLYLANVDTPGVEIRLANANGDAYPFAAGDRDRSFNYEPTFAPQASGGYMWVVFTSRRTYGTKLTNDKNSVKQLWMTAIDLHPEAGKDPSHPSFWVRGQDSNDLNMRAYWALDPCIQKGDTCKADSDCCDGSPCLDGKCGGPSTCVEVGQYCEATVDCCDPEAKCIDNSCDYDMPN